MAASSRLMLTEAERKFPARIKIAVPPAGLGRQLDDMMAWLDANCGAGNWAMAPAGMRGVVNDAIAFFFLNPTLASAFVARWCIGHRAETVEAASACGRTHRSKEPRRRCTERRRAFLLRETPTRYGRVRRMKKWLTTLYQKNISGTSTVYVGEL